MRPRRRRKRSKLSFEEQVGIFLEGRPVERPNEALRLFIICRAMEWTHLPNAGGLYDQSPRLLDAWLYIWNREAEKHERDRAIEEAKNRHRRR